MLDDPGTVAPAALLEVAGLPDGGQIRLDGQDSLAQEPLKASLGSRARSGEARGQALELLRVVVPEPPEEFIDRQNRHVRGHLYPTDGGQGAWNA